MSPPITWTYEPSVLVAMLAASIAYGYGWRRARQPGEPHPPGYGRLTLFCLSVLTILVALVSPVDGLARYLMVIHMTQHVLLLDIAPILFILSLTKGLLRPVTRRLTVIEARAGVLARPWFAVVLYVGVMWLWHVPAMYDLALRHNDIHALEHICFGAAGMLVLVAPAVTDPGALPADRDGAGRLHGGHQAAGRDARGDPRLRAALLLPLVSASP